MNKKDAILQSVLKLVNRSGFYHLNMKDIATEAGVAAGTIYNYFKGKEDLINELYHHTVTDFNTAVIVKADDGDSVSQKFFDMLHAAVDFYRKHPDHFSFIEQYTYAPFVFKEYKDENFMLLRPIFQILNRGKQEGIIKDIPDEVLLSLIHGPLITIMKLHLAHKYDLNNEENEKIFYQSVWKSITI